MGPLEPPALGRKKKSEMWENDLEKGKEAPSSQAGFQAGRIGWDTLRGHLRVAADDRGRINIDSKESRILYSLSCSPKRSTLENGSQQKPYGCVTRNSALTQIVFTSLVNVTQVQAASAVHSL